MIFWLVLKLEISYYRVIIISWRILISFRVFFGDYIFAWWNIWVFMILLFAFKYFFNVNGEGHIVTHPLYIYVMLFCSWERFFFFFFFFYYIICCGCFSSLIWYLQRSTWLMMTNKNLCRLSWSGLAVVLGSWAVLSLTSEIAFAALVWRAEQFQREREREREISVELVAKLKIVNWGRSR